MSEFKDWVVLERGNIVEVVPRGDSRDHIYGENCPCKPHSHCYETGIWVITHSSFDGRELLEQYMDTVQ